MSNSEDTLYFGIDLKKASNEIEAAILKAGTTDFMPAIPEIASLYPTHNIYHYTNIEALFNGILVKKPDSEDHAISLLATHYEYMNDKTEIIYGEKIAREIFSENYPAIIEFEKTKENYPMPIYKDYFLISFSLVSDCLPMWSMYGKNGNGIALEFDSYIILKHLRHLYPCYYSKEKAAAMISRVYENLQSSIFNTNQIAMLARDAFILKHSIQVIKESAYEYEKEVRFICDFTESIEYRYANNLIIPYVKQYLPKNALKRVIVGPNLDKERTIKSIKRYIDSLGFAEVNVVGSKVPYRN